MPTGPGFPSGTNTFIPNFDASGRLVVGYSRNPKKFRLVEYIQYIGSPKSLGYYLKLTAQEAARVVTQQDFEWPDGSQAPNGADGEESFNFLPFTTHRYAYPYVLGQKAVEQAEWSVVEQHSQIHAAQLMTARTNRMLTVLTTASNWQTSADPDLSANHTNNATSLAGGKFNAGSSTSPYFKIGLDTIAVLINQDTLGVVEPGQLHVVMNPTTARKIAEGQEVHDYIKGSYWAMDELRTGQSPNGQFGLPSSMYGYPIVVEDCVIVSSRKGASLTKAYALPDGAVLVMAKVGELEGVYGAPSFSTAVMYYYTGNGAGDMVLEVKNDVDNRRVMGRLVEDTAEILTSPLSGYYVTAAI